jgi:hypothetical protein
MLSNNTTQSLPKIFFTALLHYFITVTILVFSQPAMGCHGLSWVVIDKKRQKNITRALTGIISVDMHHPHMMKGSGFISDVKEIEPIYVVPHPTTFTRTYIPKAYQDAKK